MKLPILNIKGKETGREATLAKPIFGVDPHEHSVYLSVKQIRANTRQGTSKTKERGEIKGSTRKIKKQKGTGTARAGSIKNPLFRGGGRIFGPSPRNYDTKLNRKVKELARRSALSSKAKSKNIVVIEDFDFQTPKTKSFLKILENLKLGSEKIMLIMSESKNSVLLSAKNLKKANVVLFNEINVYNILDAQKLIIVESALENLNKK